MFQAERERGLCRGLEEGCADVRRMLEAEQEAKNALLWSLHDTQNSLWS